MACYMALLGKDRAEILKNLSRALSLDPEVEANGSWRYRLGELAR